MLKIRFLLWFLVVSSGALAESGQRSAVSARIENQQNYHSCVISAARLYAPSKSTAYEIADASLSYCISRLEKFETELARDLDFGGMRKRAEEQAKKEALELRKLLRSKAVAEVVKYRLPPEGEKTVEDMALRHTKFFKKNH